MNITSGDSVAIELAGAKITLPAAIVADLWLESIKGRPSTFGLPKIGTRGAFGIIAGLTRGADGESDKIVEVLDYAPKKMNWRDASAYAESVGGILMTRRTAPLCFANVPELFEKTWHWLQEQYEGDDACAWVQYFADGLQHHVHEGHESPVRPVRLVDPSVIR
jgi:hypothetical protein